MRSKWNKPNNKMTNTTFGKNASESLELPAPLFMNNYELYLMFSFLLSISFYCIWRGFYRVFARPPQTSSVFPALIYLTPSWHYTRLLIPAFLLNYYIPYYTYNGVFLCVLVEEISVYLTHLYSGESYWNLRQTFANIEWLLKMGPFNVFADLAYIMWSFSSFPAFSLPQRIIIHYVHNFCVHTIVWAFPSCHFYFFIIVGMYVRQKYLCFAGLNDAFQAYCSVVYNFFRHLPTAHFASVQISPWAAFVASALHYCTADMCDDARAYCKCFLWYVFLAFTIPIALLFNLLFPSTFGFVLNFSDQIPYDFVEQGWRQTCVFAFRDFMIVYRSVHHHATTFISLCLLLSAFTFAILVLPVSSVYYGLTETNQSYEDLAYRVLFWPITHVRVAHYFLKLGSMDCARYVVRLTALVNTLRNNPSKTTVAIAVAAFIEPSVSDEQVEHVVGKFFEFLPSFDFQSQSLADVQNFWKSARESEKGKMLQKALLYLLSFSVCQKVSGLTFDDVSFEKMSKTAAKQKFSSRGEDFYYTVFSIFSWFCTNGYNAFMNRDLRCLFISEKQTSNFIQKADSVLNKMEFLATCEDHGFTLDDLEGDLRETIKVGRKLVGICRDSDFAIKMLNDKISRLESALLRLTAVNTSSRNRRPPFTVLFYGEPGIGKSAACSETVHYFYRYQNIEFDLQKNLYSRNAADKFMSGYNPTIHKAFLLDDIASEPVKILQMTPDNSVTCIIKFNNTQACLTNQADVESKGKVPFRSSLIVATTNVKDLHARYAAATPGAVWRRYPYVVTPVLKSEFQDANGMFAKSVKYEKDAWLFTVERPVITPSNSGNPCPDLEYVPVEYNGQRLVAAPASTYYSWLGAAIDKHNYNCGIMENLWKYQNDRELCGCGLPLFVCTKHVDTDVELPATYDESVKYNLGEAWLYKHEREATPEDLPLVEYHAQSATIYLWLLYIWVFGYLKAFGVRVPDKHLTMTTALLTRIIASPFQKAFCYLVQLVDLSGEFSQRVLQILITHKWKVLFGFAFVIALLSAVTTWYKERKYVAQSSGFWSEKLFDRVNLTRESITSQFALTHGKIGSNVIGVHVGNKFCNGIVIDRQHVLLPRHAFVEGGPWKVRVIEEVASSEKLGRTSCGIIDISELSAVGHDIVLVELRFMMPRRNILKFVPEESPKGILRGIHFSRQPDGKLTSTTVGAETITAGYSISTPSGDVEFAPEKEVYATSVPTVEGQSGSMFLAEINGHPALVGMHVAGSVIGGLSEKIDKSRIRHSVGGVGDPITTLEDYGFEVVDTHPRSPLLHQSVEGDVDLVGSIVAHRSSPKSHVSDTPIKLEVEREFGVEVDYGKPTMKGFLAEDGEYRDPMVIAANQFARPGVANQSHFRFAAECYVNDLKRGLPHKTLAPLDFDTAVNGLDGNPWYKRIPLNTSPGFPFTGAKMNFVEVCDPTPDHALLVQPDERIMDIYHKMLSNYQNDVRAYAPFVSHLKDEPRSRKKIEAAKTRVFTGAQFALTILIRQYFLPIVVELLEQPFVSEMCVGQNPHGKFWKDLYDHITQHSGGENCIDLDHPHYDKWVPLVATITAWNDVLIRLAGWYGYAEEHLRVMRAMSTDVTIPLICYWLDFFMPYGSNPSGQSLTTIINSIINSLLWRIAYLRCGYDPKTFQRYVALQTYGDDCLAEVSPERPKFNFIGVANAIGEIGPRPTPGRKEMGDYDYTDVSEVTFLKRSFDVRDGVVYAPLDKKSIFKSLCVHLPSKSIEVEDQMAAAIISAQMEMVAYGPEVYYDFVRKIRDVLKTHHGIRSRLHPMHDLDWVSFRDRLFHWDDDQSDAKPS